MTLRDLIDSVSLADYVEQYAELERRGGELWCRSPLNPNDTDPSFSINPERNVFMDFSSGQSGNIINFIMAYNGVGIAEAITKLKQWANVDGEIEYSTLPIVKTLRKYKPNKTNGTCEHSLIDLNELNRYQVRSFPFWEKEGIESDTALRWGCGVDKYNQCLTIPIFDQLGNVINILCRTTNPDAKQLGIPKYIYKKKLGNLDFFYGWYQHQFDIADRKQIILVEGCKSVMKLEQWGYDNAVAMLTSHLGDAQLPILIRSGYDCVFMLDHDVNPYKDENIQKLKRFCRVYLCSDTDGLTGEKDSPCDCGLDVFEHIYNKRKILK